MRYRLIGTLLVLGAVSNAFAATFTVNLTNALTFVPSSINIEVGDTVTWVNPMGGLFHGVHSDDGTTFTFGPMAAPWTFSHIFTTAGKFPYYCQVHGGAGGVGMSGVVYVRATHAANEHILQLSAWDFQPRDAGTTTASASGFYRTVGGSPAELVAGVHLPTGTTITGIEMVACDTDPVNDLFASLLRFDEPGIPVVTLTSAGTSNAPGCGFFSSGVIAESVQNLNTTYIVIVSNASASANLSFRTVRIYYKTAVSPGPLTATFNDVPTTHPFFRFVEALYAAGITAGCGNGNFCPDQNVTRGQMAVFIAAGLGLFWPN